MDVGFEIVAMRGSCTSRSYSDHRLTPVALDRTTPFPLSTADAFTSTHKHTRVNSRRPLAPIGRRSLMIRARELLHPELDRSSTPRRLVGTYAARLHSRTPIISAVCASLLLPGTRLFVC